VDGNKHITSNTANFWKNVHDILGLDYTDSLSNAVSSQILSPGAYILPAEQIPLYTIKENILSNEYYNKIIDKLLKLYIKIYYHSVYSINDSTLVKISEYYIRY
jgi:hypothetical protein